jgi:hypothetical protein
VRPIPYSISDIIIAFTQEPTPCSCSSFSNTHRYMVFFRNQTFALTEADSVRPIDYSVSDSRVVFAPEPTPWSCSSLSHTHRSMGIFHNPSFVLTAADSVRPIDYSVSDRTESSIVILVDKDDLINYQLLIIYQLLIRTFTY